jgi:hypothetical protein
MNSFLKMVIITFSISPVLSCTKNAVDPNGLSAHQANNVGVLSPEATVIKASGDISTALDQFRNLLGTLNTAPGAVGGRREVNWDGGPDELTNNDRFPGDFFAAVDPLLPNGRKRGLVNTTPGTGFTISNNNFEFLKQEYGNQFRAFSPLKTFAAVQSTITDNTFKIPGTNTDATVQAFGVVFSDVDNASSTRMEFYNGDRLLGTFKVPNNGNNEHGKFSFLGVYFPNEKVSRVRIYCGSAALSANQDDLSDGGGEDLVVMDDFIYSEPAN